jgi:hypothetical protein
MGRLHDVVKRIDAAILRKGLPVFKTKGLIAIKAGFPLALIDAETPDDPRRIAALRAAASEVLGELI